MRTSIIFYDSVAPTSYIQKQSTDGMGGTESTVLKVLTEIRDQDIPVGLIWNKNNSNYVQTNDNVTHVINIRIPGNTEFLAKTYPNAKQILWMHDVPTFTYQDLETLKKYKVTVVCVSNWHKTQCVEMLKSFGYQGEFPIVSIYNPVVVHKNPEGKKYDKNLLVFAASPHKGLQHSLDVFRMAREHIPTLKLEVFNPGYYPIEPFVAKLPEKVTIINTRSQIDLHYRLGEALALWHLNPSFPETFGLVMAEANALRVPCITSDIGAAGEICDRPDIECMDTTNYRTVIERVKAWHSGNRPHIVGNKEFNLETVMYKWNKLLKSS